MHLTNKEKEVNYIKLMRKSIDSIPNGDIIAFERPDFILNTDSSKIGIEVTRLYKSPDVRGIQYQIQENEQRLLRAECKRVYDAMGFPKVEVNLIFNSNTSFNKKNRREYARKISLLVASHVPTENNAASVVNDYKNAVIFPYELHSFSVYRLGYDDSVWGESGVGVVQQEFINELQDVINKKNDLLPDYDQSLIYHWLLVVIEGVNESSFFDPTFETLDHIYTSSFNKVFLYNGFSEKGYELKIQSPTT